MRQLRVALVGCSGLLGDIIAGAVEREQDLVVVADLPAPPLPEDLSAGEVDVVVWNDPQDAEPPQWLEGLGRDRCPPVLATLGDGRDASMWELVPQRTALGSLSPTTLVETIRSLAAGTEGVA